MMIKNLCDLLITDYWQNVQPKEFQSFSSLAGKENWFTALRHFKNYAYERNVSGAAARYRQIAEEAIACMRTGPAICDLKREGEIWNQFKAGCKSANINFNPTVDPLKPSNGSKKNLVRFVVEVSISKDKTIAAWAFRMISENKLKEAHASLKTVWGVGDKIASFYLRDIFWLGHDLNPRVSVDDCYLLQPVDIWVRRAAEALGHKQESARSIADFVSSFEKASGIAHGGGNIAFWILGAKYLNELEQFRSVIKAIGNKGTHTSERALSVARRFEDFGATLRKVIMANLNPPPTPEA
jgi:hypothetical protein